MPDQNATLDRLDDQIGWYDRKSLSNQARFKLLKLVTLVAGGLVPILALSNAPSIAVAGVGFLIVVVEGLQQLNQYYANWISYRSTCEALKHEKFLFLAKAGPYAAAIDSIVLLAERIEGLVSQEHAKWVSAQEQVTKPKQEPAKPS
jgi:Protein of unknown function (DUF4231)